jgi:hypothetical protein
MTYPIPPGFEQCGVCGEFNGKTQAKYLTWDNEPPESFGTLKVSDDLRAWLRELKRERESSRDPERYVSVTCLCKGPLCKRCGLVHIHRPISNSYDPLTNTVEHWPYFMGMSSCRTCRAQEDQARTASLPH